MIKAPGSIQRLLSDAASIIGSEDFPAKCPNLIQVMIERFSSDDSLIINGVLYTAHSIFKRYRNESQYVMISITDFLLLFIYQLSHFPHVNSCFLL